MISIDIGSRTLPRVRELKLKRALWPNVRL